MKKHAFPKPISLTHQHIFACINTLIKKQNNGVIRILDAGCGNGVLISFLYKTLSMENPDISFEIYGFDVANHGVQSLGFFDKTVAYLSSEVPEIKWNNHLRLLRVGESWDYEPDFFDIVISNQVLEHVGDKNFFFSEMARVLKEYGFAIHLFPLIHYIYEGHIFLPWAHRIRSWNLLRTYISIMSLLGLGKFKTHKKQTGISRQDFSERHADCIYFFTNYSSEKQILDIAKNNSLRASFKFSSGYYKLKILKTFRIPLNRIYRSKSSGLFDSIAIKFLRYIASITLVCQKRSRF